jgi:hypothetical protein
MMLKLDPFRKIIFLAFLLLSFLLLHCDERSYSLAEAQRVLEAIARVQMAAPLPIGLPLRKVVISESELNSYIAFRIDREKEQIMKELKIKILEGNRIEGKVFIDLTRQRIPRILRPQMTFYFEAKVLVEKGRVRLDIKKLFLEKQLIHPLILDLIIFISAQLDRTSPTRINDWYELPFGVKDIKSDKGRAFFYY